MSNYEHYFTAVLFSTLLGSAAGYLMSRWHDRIHSRLEATSGPLHYNQVDVCIHNGHDFAVTDCSAHLTLTYDQSTDLLEPPHGREACLTPTHSTPIQEARLGWVVPVTTQHTTVTDLLPDQRRILQVLEIDEEKRWVGIFSESAAVPYRVFLRPDRKYHGTIRIICRETVCKRFRFELDPQVTDFPLKITSATRR